MKPRAPPNGGLDQLDDDTGSGRDKPFNKLFDKMAGLNMGYVDGSAAWVTKNKMGCFYFIGYPYYDTTRL